MSNNFPQKEKPFLSKVTWQTVKKRSSTSKIIKRNPLKGKLGVLEKVGRFFMSAGITIWISYLFCMDNSHLYGFDFEIFNIPSIIFLVTVFLISFVYNYRAQFGLLLITGILFFLNNYGTEFPDPYKLVSIFFPLDWISISAYCLYIFGNFLGLFVEKKNSSKSLMACFSIFLPGINALFFIVYSLGLIGLSSWLMITLFSIIGNYIGGDEKNILEIIVLKWMQDPNYAKTSKVVILLLLSSGILKILDIMISKADHPYSLK